MYPQSVGSSFPHTVVSEGLDHLVNLTCDQHEVTGNRSFGSACRLEVDRCATRIEGVMARPFSIKRCRSVIDLISVHNGVLIDAIIYSTLALIWNISEWIMVMRTRKTLA